MRACTAVVHACSIWSLITINMPRAQIANCLKHARESGHRVVSISLGGYAKAEDADIVAQIQNICNKDGLVVVSAGNGVNTTLTDRYVGVDIAGALTLLVHTRIDICLWTKEASAHMPDACTRGTYCAA